MNGLRRLIERRLARRLPPGRSAAVIGDLIEDYRRQQSARGRWRAALWLVRESESIVAAYRADRTRHLRLTASDWRAGARALRRRPGFTVSAVLALGVGLGAATASYAIFDALLLQPLAYPDAQRLVFLSAVLPGEGEPGASLSFTDVRDLVERMPALEGAAGYSDTLNVQSTTPGGPIGVRVNIVQGPYFSLLGARAERGRLLGAEDDLAPGQHPFAVVSDRFWRERLNGAADVLGATLPLNGRPFTIVGVMTPHFRDVPFEMGGDEGLGFDTDVWISSMMSATGLSPTAPTVRNTRISFAIGKLRAGVTLAEARAQVDAAGIALDDAYPDTNRRIRFDVQDLASWMFRTIQRPLWFIFGASMTLLLVGALNVGGLLLVRQQERSRELVIRRALGASSGQLFALVAAESMLIATAAAGVGAFVTVALLAAVRRTSPVIFPRLQAATFDAGAAVLLTGLALGAAGAIAAVAAIVIRRQTAAIKPAATRALTADRRVLRVQHAIVVAEVALAAVLLVCGTLVVASLVNATTRPVGFDANDVVAARFSLRDARYADDEAVWRFARDVVDGTRGIPGVEGVAVWGPGRPGRSTWIAYPVPERDAGQPDPDRVMVWRHNISPGALALVGVELVKGREFLSTDASSRPFVAVVSESMAQRFWPDADPIGQRFTIVTTATPRPWFTVVGVARDAAQRGRLYSLSLPNYDFYQLIEQRAERSLHLLARTDADAETIAPSLRAALGPIDHDLALQDIAPLASLLRTESGTLRFASGLLAGYAALAFALSMFGVYALVSYVLSLRSRELALRQALGATAGRLFTSVLAQGARLGAAGAALGLGVAWFAAASLETVLFGVSARAPLIYGGVGVTVLAIVVAATMVPSRRIGRLDPARVLGVE